MPLRALVAFTAILMATIAGQNTLLHSEANNSPTACARAACTPSAPVAESGTVLGHEVLTGGCPNGDLHVMRYTPGTASTPLIATWCG
jgi:hypothetical protein